MIDSYSGDVNTWMHILLFGGGGLLWATIVGSVVFAFRDRHAGAHGAPRSREEDQLFKKFARGEIDDDEYRTRREALRGMSPV
jgi:putative membrane protein